VSKTNTSGYSRDLGAIGPALPPQGFTVSTLYSAPKMDPGNIPNRNLPPTPSL
jgi:hypothetical protein